MNVIYLSVICAQGTGASLLCYVWNTEITCFDVLPVDCHVAVSLCCTLLVPKSQGMQQLVYNCTLWQTSVALQVQILALWVIENLWLIVVREERHFVTTRSLIVSCISAEATTNSQTWWSQYNMSVVPVICEKQLSECAGWRSAS